MALSVPKLPSVLVVDYVLFSRDIARILAERGFQVSWLSPKRLAVADFEAACLKHRPRFLFSINFSPELAFLCSRYQLPYLSWTVDPLPRQRFRLYPGTDVTCCRVFCHQRALVDRFRGLGFRSARFLPLAAPDRRVPVADRSRLESEHCSVSFVGQSLIREKVSAQAALREAGGDTESLDEAEAWLQQLACSEADAPDFLGLATRPDLILPSLRALAESGRLEPDQMIDLLDGWLAHEVRRARVRALTAYGLQTYGDDGWSCIAGNYRGFARHYDQLNWVYAASKANLDLPRVYQRDIVTMRVFDVMACGGVLLSEWQEDLADWFVPGEHLMMYRSTAEMVETVSDLLAISPMERQAMGHAARNRVISQHRLTSRVEEMLRNVP